jgi:transcriptional regulator with XRE-family HTH domain
MSSPANPIAARLGENLARARGRVGISQETLGVMASVHRAEVSILERGIRVPRIDTAIKLAVSLGVPLATLIEGIEWSPGSTNLGSFGLSGRGTNPRS